MNEFQTMDEQTEDHNQTKPSVEQCRPISYNDVANKLLSDRFLLTALEFHSELVECGKEIPKLKEFFSNPGNFENQFSKPEYCAMGKSSNYRKLIYFKLLYYQIPLESK